MRFLTPDFLRKDGALEIVVAARPDVFNHNLETVPSLYLRIRPGARYFHSLRLLQRVKELDLGAFTKSGIMVGLGETRDEVLQVMDDLRSAGVDFLTIGQYLQPTRKHAEVRAFVTPDEFKAYERIALAKGFLLVGKSADALELSCRCRLRTPQGGPTSPAPLADAMPMPFQRALVIGCSGAGKSTFARRLGTASGIPVIHLDQLFWYPDWKMAPAQVYRERLDAALGGERWILDGSNPSTLAHRLRFADTVFWLDLARWRCLGRVARRVMSTYGRVRPDMAAGCPERFDADFLRYVWRFHTHYNPRMDTAIAECGAHARLYRFESDREAQAFLESLR